MYVNLFFTSAFYDNLTNMDSSFLLLNLHIVHVKLRKINRIYLFFYN